MRNGTYTAKRRAGQEWRNTSGAYGYSSDSGNAFSRNRNTVRFSGNGKLGKLAIFGTFFMMVFLLGFFYVSQSAKATSYDYEISAIESEISELEAKKEDLAVERARLTSIATSNSSKVAAAMEDAHAEGYAE
jgi:hypothetical protein